MDNLSQTERKAHSVAFDKLLDGYVTAGRITEAKALVENMVNYGVRPSKFTLASVVTLWGCARQLERAYNAVETMSKTYDIVPDNLVRLSLLKACLANDDVSRAFQVFDIIKSTADGAESKTYEAMINSCARLGWYKESARLVEEACGLSHVKTNFSQKDLDPKVFENLAAMLEKAGLMGSIGNSLFQRLQSSQLIAPALV
eukprot:TRINITY_DN629_c0_g1_i3.p1 TRINITY_DN629_c0_g1~~TRINITY_DN629_c0_g1_i3.p1  ORF type:complete len:224 (-),score=43.99 TRINITY_DN629_c0_g1_i3:72-674(-)